MRTFLAADLIWFLLAGMAAAAPSPADSCRMEQAQIEFSAGALSYHRTSWESAIPHLENAAHDCPIAPKPIPVKIDLFLTYPYAPFYYLGKSHDKLEHQTDALRYFYLSSCFERAEPDVEELDDLPTVMDRCQRRTAALKDTDKGPASFGNGHAAAEQEDWTQAAEQMWGSLQIRTEDGKTILPAGRWPEQYVPRAHLARALFKLGCVRQACEQIQRSKLKALAAGDRSGKYKEDVEQMQWLEGQCAIGLKGEHESDWICKQWVCLLQLDRRTMK